MSINNKERKKEQLCIEEVEKVLQVEVVSTKNVVFPSNCIYNNN